HASPDSLGNAPRKQRRDCIAHLYELCSPLPHEEVVVRKCLCPGRFPNCKTPALGRIRMDEVVPVFSNMADNGSGWKSWRLDPEPVRELAALPALVICRKLLWKVFEPRGGRLAFPRLGVRRTIKVSPQVRRHVPSGIVIERHSEARV